MPDFYNSYSHLFFILIFYSKQKFTPTVAFKLNAPNFHISDTSLLYS